MGSPVAALLVVVLLVLGLARPAHAVLSWRQVRERLDSRELRDAHAVVNVSVTHEADGALRLRFVAFGENVDARLPADSSLFAAAQSIEHIEMDPRGRQLRARAERTDCMWASENATANDCGGGFSATVRLPGLGARIALTALSPSVREAVSVQCFAHRLDAQVDEPWSCGGHAHAPAPLEMHLEPHQEPRTAHRSLQARKTFFVKMLIVNDHAQFRAHGGNTHAVAASVLQQVQQLYRQLSRLLKFEVQVQVVGMISFSHGDPWALQLVNGETEHGALLSEFARWRSAQLSARGVRDHGIAHLLSGLDFAGNVVGLANVAQLCSDAAGAGVVQTPGFSLDTVATILAHELAHNLGAFHTDRAEAGTLVPAPCLRAGAEVGAGFIMDPSGIRENAWSRCTAGWLEMAFGETNYPLGCQGSACAVRPTYGTRFVRCADAQATQVWTLAPTCGNGIREAGEACDCGQDDCSGIDPCCDGASCRLRGDSACSADDACCDAGTCQFRRASDAFVCRQAADDECDAAETCDGASATCPHDARADTGSTCAAGDGSDGACFAGSCMSHESQCALFGARACPGADGDDGDAACGRLACRFGRFSEVCSFVPGTERVLVDDGTPCALPGNSAGARGVCQAQRCAAARGLALPPAITCSNGELDAGETDVDCGGPSCFPCLPGEACLADADCFNTTEQPGRCARELPPSPPPLVFDPPPAGFTCDSYESAQACAPYSGCMWVQALERCRPTGWLPPSGRCGTQRKDTSCFVWQACEWEVRLNNDDGGICDEKPTPAPTPAPPGTCVALNRGSGASDGGGDDGLGKSLLEAIKENALVFGLAVGGALLLGCCLAAIVVSRHCGPQEHRLGKHRRSTGASSASTRASARSAVSTRSSYPSVNSDSAAAGPARPPRPSAAATAAATAPRRRPSTDSFEAQLAAAKRISALEFQRQQLLHPPVVQVVQMGQSQAAPPRRRSPSTDTLEAVAAAAARVRTIGAPAPVVPQQQPQQQQPQQQPQQQQRRPSADVPAAISAPQVNAAPPTAPPLATAVPRRRPSTDSLEAQQAAALRVRAIGQPAQRKNAKKPESAPATGVDSAAAATAATQRLAQSANLAAAMPQPPAQPLCPHCSVRFARALNAGGFCNACDHRRRQQEAQAAVAMATAPALVTAQEVPRTVAAHQRQRALEQQWQTRRAHSVTALRANHSEGSAPSTSASSQLTQQQQQQQQRSQSTTTAQHMRSAGGGDLGLPPPI